MSYIKAEKVLPKEIIDLIQKYVDGECIYIPRMENKRKTWGESTQIRMELGNRDKNIFADYLDGLSTNRIAEKYCLSQKSIQRIICDQKKKTA